MVRELEIFVSMEGVLNLEDESSRLHKEISKLEAELAKVRKKLANEDFLSTAPADIVVKEREKSERLSAKLEKLETQLERLVQLGTEV